MRQVAIFMIPVATGLVSAMWTRLVAESFVLNCLINAAVGLIAAAIFLAAGQPWPKSVGLGYSALVVYLGASVLLTWLWMTTATLDNGTTDSTPVALAEIAWPIFTAFFMWWLYGVWSLNIWQISGGIVSLIGVAIVVVATK